LKELEKYQAVIDLQDVVSVQKIRTESDTKQYVKDKDQKQFYEYTYFIQINLSSVNGITRKFIPS
jgi:hypothetical protein